MLVRTVPLLGRHAPDKTPSLASLAWLDADRPSSGILRKPPSTSENDTPKPRNPPCFVCFQSFVLRFDLIASDINQWDSLIGKSRIIGRKFRLIGFDWSPAKTKPSETIDWTLLFIINNQNIQNWITFELAIRIRNAKGYSDEYCFSPIYATPVA